MKKTLVSALSAALVVGAASTTFAAANPFSDVPANSWAYNAVATLAKDGVVNGFPNGTFQGQKTMTRYEMAQIVAKAMAYENMTKADKAIVDKLAVEFGSELQNLGVRVSNLEKKSDNVKLTGKVEYKYVSGKNDGVKSHESALKFKLEPTAFVNDKLSAHAEIEYTLLPEKDTGNVTVNDDGDVTAENTVSVSKVYVNTKLAGADLTAGRWGAYLGNGLVYDHELTGAQVVAGGDKTTVTAAVGRMHDNDSDSAVDSTANVYAVQVNHKVSDKFGLAAGYTMVRNAEKVFNYMDYSKSAVDATKAKLVEALSKPGQPLEKEAKAVETASTNVENAIKAKNKDEEINKLKNILADNQKALDKAIDKEVGKAAAAKEPTKEAKAYNAAVAQAKDAASQANVWYVGADAEVAKDLHFIADYAKNTKADVFNKAYSLELHYKGEDPAKAGSYGAFVAYRNLGQYAALQPTYDAIGSNQKGIEAGVTYVPAENIVATVKYFNGKNLALPGEKETKANKLYTKVEFLF